jgi:hypothetical protein
MKTFYFVGGPKPGRGEEFFQRLVQVGGSPPNWQIYPHVAYDGQSTACCKRGILAEYS